MASLRGSSDSDGKESEKDENTACQDDSVGDQEDSVEVLRASFAPPSLCLLLLCHSMQLAVRTACGLSLYLEFGIGIVGIN